MTRYYEDDLSKRITFDLQIVGGEPIIRARRLAVEHVIGMLAAGDTAQDVLAAYSWLEIEDARACFVVAPRAIAHARYDPPLPGPAA